MLNIFILYIYNIIFNKHIRIHLYVINLKLIFYCHTLEAYYCKLWTFVVKMFYSTRVRNILIIEI